jgi:hypothetical protein
MTRALRRVLTDTAALQGVTRAEVIRRGVAIMANYLIAAKGWRSYDDLHAAADAGRVRRGG